VSRLSAAVPATPRPRHLAFALLLSLAATPAWAQRVPQTVQLTNGLNTGGTSFLDGFTRTDPGWAIVQYARYTHLDAIEDARGDDVPAFRGTDIGSTLLLTQFAYATRYKLFGGVLGLNALVPLVNLDASFAADSPARLRDNGFGLGDITFGPYLQMLPTMRDGRPVFVQRFEFDAIAPVGKFDRDRDLNQSSGYWSLVPNWAFTVLPTPQWEISARLNYVYNFRADKAANPPQLDGFAFRNGQAGDAFWVNFASSYALTPAFRLGVNGYYLKQLRDNRTNGVRVADTKQSQFYLGPGMSWRIDAHNIFNANVYLPVEVKNAASGNNVNFQYTHVF
jgi:Protein involved in meta-pathway of phenol degradation